MLASRHIQVDTGKKARPEAAKVQIGQRAATKKAKLRRLLLLPWQGLRWLLYNLPKGIFWVLNMIFSFFSQLLMLVFHYLSQPFRPVLKVVFKAYNTLYSWFEKKYHAILVWSLGNKGFVIFWSLAFLAITILAATRIPRELMPKPDAVAFEVNLKTPVDYSLEQTSEIVQTLENWLSTRAEVKASFSQIGIVSGMEALNPDISLNSAKLYVEAHAVDQVEPLMGDLRQRMQAVPGMTFSLVKEQSTLAQLMAFSTAEVGLKVKGEDLNRLRILAETLVGKISSVSGITDIVTNLGEGKPEFLVSINKQAVEKYGIFPATIGNYLTNAVGGKIASEFKELEKKFDILVRLDENIRENIDTLLDEQISHQGMLIPLRELVSYQIARGPKEIRREGQQREVLVTANLSGKKISQVVPEIRKKIAELELPPGYHVVFSGEQEEMAQSFQSLILAFSLAVLLVYMIMAAQFESLKHPFLILFTLPMGVTGAFWALILTGQSLNVISVIGMVVLAGIVVNDAIVKIDYTNQMRRSGMSVREAIMEASRVRLRPILMTTVTTALGLFPMSLGLGKGSELQQPLAIAVIGGLMLATFLTLILIPLAYEMAEKKGGADS